MASREIQAACSHGQTCRMRFWLRRLAAKLCGPGTRNTGDRDGHGGKKNSPARFARHVLCGDKQGIKQDLELPLPVPQQAREPEPEAGQETEHSTEPTTEHSTEHGVGQCGLDSTAARFTKSLEEAALEKVAVEALEHLRLVEDGLSVSSGVLSENGAQGDKGTDGRVLARFILNEKHFISVFKATTDEDMKDLYKVMPKWNPQSAPQYVYILARLELRPHVCMHERLAMACKQRVAMSEAIGPAVGCIFASIGTNLNSSFIFEFDDPDALAELAMQQRMEAWGLTVPPDVLLGALAAERSQTPLAPACDAGFVETVEAEEGTEGSVVQRDERVQLADTAAEAEPETVTRAPEAAAAEDAKNAEGQGADKKEPAEAKTRVDVEQHAHALEQAEAGPETEAVAKVEVCPGGNFSDLEEKSEGDEHAEHGAEADAPVLDTDKHPVTSDRMTRDRHNLSVAMLYALCGNARTSGIRGGLCSPPPGLLKRWQAVGMELEEVPVKRIVCPSHLPDYEKYKANVLAAFRVETVHAGLRKKLLKSAPVST